MANSLVNRFLKGQKSPVPYLPLVFIASGFEALEKMVAIGDFFTINRARQYSHRLCGEKDAILRKCAENNSYICRMKDNNKRAVYIWQHADWPTFRWEVPITLLLITAND